MKESTFWWTDWLNYGSIFLPHMFLLIYTWIVCTVTTVLSDQITYVKNHHPIVTIVCISCNYIRWLCRHFTWPGTLLDGHTSKYRFDNYLLLYILGQNNIYFLGICTSTKVVVGQNMCIGVRLFFIILMYLCVHVHRNLFIPEVSMKNIGYYVCSVK